MPYIGAYGKGDQNVSVNLKIPKKISKKALELTKELEKELGSSDRLGVDFVKHNIRSPQN